MISEKYNQVKKLNHRLYHNSIYKDIGNELEKVYCLDYLDEIMINLVATNPRFDFCFVAWENSLTQ